VGQFGEERVPARGQATDLVRAKRRGDERYGHAAPPGVSQLQRLARRPGRVRHGATPKFV
jgi:hypothetical protein